MLPRLFLVITNSSHCTRLPAVCTSIRPVTHSNPEQDTKAAIKIYEMCCPNSDERVCAIKAKPPVVVSTIKLIHKLMLDSQTTIKVSLMAHKSYDALNFDQSLVDKYGGYIPDDCGPLEMMQLASHAARHGQSIVPNHHPNPHPHSHPPPPHSQLIPAFASEAMMNEPHNHLPYVRPRGLVPPTNFLDSAHFQAMSPLSPNPYRPQCEYIDQCESNSRSLASSLKGKTANMPTCVILSSFSSTIVRIVATLPVPQVTSNISSKTSGRDVAASQEPQISALPLGCRLSRHQLTSSSDSPPPGPTADDPAAAPQLLQRPVADDAPAPSRTATTDGG